MNPAFQALADQVAKTVASETAAIEHINVTQPGATEEEIKAATDATAALKVSQDALDAAVAGS